jgi:hypothetical protein
VGGIFAPIFLGGKAFSSASRLGKEVIMTGKTNPYGVEFFDRDVPVT